MTPRNQTRPELVPSAAEGRSRREPLYCPNCSLPRRRVHFNGEVYQCHHCKSWWSVAFVAEHERMFVQGGPAGYDPETGFEAQAR